MPQAETRAAMCSLSRLSHPAEVYFFRERDLTASSARLTLFSLRKSNLSHEMSREMSHEITTMSQRSNIQMQLQLVGTPRKPPHRVSRAYTL